MDTITFSGYPLRNLPIGIQSFEYLFQNGMMFNLLVNTICPEPCYSYFLHRVCRVADFSVSSQRLDIPGAEIR